MKIVLDTNTLLVSVSDRSPYYPIYHALQNGWYQLIITTDILLEYEEVIGIEMGIEVAEDILAFLSVTPNAHKITRYYYWRLIQADPDDDKFVDAAVAGNADYIVTDDRHFRVLAKIDFPKIKVLTTRQFLDLLATT